MAKKWIDAHGHFVAPGTGVNRAPGTQAGEAWVFAPETRPRTDTEHTPARPLGPEAGGEVP